MIPLLHNFYIIVSDCLEPRIIIYGMLIRSCFEYRNVRKRIKKLLIVNFRPARTENWLIPPLWYKLSENHFIILRAPMIIIYQYICL